MYQDSYRFRPPRSDATGSVRYLKNKIGFTTIIQQSLLLNMPLYADSKPASATVFVPLFK
jgi:hypothetical protein